MDFLDAIVISDSLRNLKEGYCSRDAMTRAYMARHNGQLSLEVIVRAAEKCACRDCNDALQRYAHNTIRTQFGEGK